MTYEDNVEFNSFLDSKEFLKYSCQQDIQTETQESLQSTMHDSPQSMKISDYLVAFSTQAQNYCIGCVDMVNSTRIAAGLSQLKISAYYEIFLNSMSKIIGRLGGNVIKNVGDCLLYYFPGHVNSKIDGMKNCLDCGLLMIGAQEIICKQLESKELPRLDYRVSADYGPTIIMNTTTSTCIDLIGPPVNMCTKINHCAGKNEFVIGGDFREIVKKYNEYRFEQTRGFNLGLPQTYPVFKVSRK